MGRPTTTVPNPQVQNQNPLPSHPLPQQAIYNPPQAAQPPPNYHPTPPQNNPINQPPPPPVRPTPLHGPHQQWSTGLFDCMQDPTSALLTCCCPCVTFGQIAEIIDSGFTTCSTAALIYTGLALVAFPCTYSCGYRRKLRVKFNLVESPCPDWVVHVCCECCAIAQAYRELNNRGLDPALGWIGNQHRQAVAMTAPTPQTMSMQ